MKDKSYYMLIVAILLLATIALMLFLFVHQADEKFEDSIMVEEKGITETLIPVKDLVLTPGAKKDYHVKLICEASGVYFIHAEFIESYDGGMKEFVNVFVELNGERVYEGCLAELLDDGIVVSTEGELHAKEPIDFSFVYEMPVTVGNEAMGTCSEFDVKISIEKK